MRSTRETALFRSGELAEPGGAGAGSSLGGSSWAGSSLAGSSLGGLRAGFTSEGRPSECVQLPISAAPMAGSPRHRYVPIRFARFSCNSLRGERVARRNARNAGESRQWRFREQRGEPRQWRFRGDRRRIQTMAVPGASQGNRGHGDFAGRAYANRGKADSAGIAGESRQWRPRAPRAARPIGSAVCPIALLPSSP